MNNSKSSALQSFLIPISIIVAGVFVAGAVLMSSGKSTSGDAAPAQDTVADVQGTEEDPTATVSIDDDPVLGNRESAKVAIVEFSDYECPFCKRHFDQTYSQIKKNFIDTGDAILVFRDFPLSFHDPLATKEARAAECVQDIAGDGKYYEYHDLIFTNTTSNGNGLAESKLYDLAEKVGINRAEFSSCYDSGKFEDEVAKDLSDGQKAGISGTPGFVIGTLNDDGTVDGVKVSGAQPYSVFEQVINEQLSK